MCRKERVGRRGKTPFYFGDFSRYSPGGAGRRLYTPPVHPCPIQRTGKDYTGQAVPDARADHARHGAPTHTPGCWPRCTGLHTIPDRPRWADRDGGGVLEGVECVRNCADMDTRATHQNRLYFYHFFVYVCCPCNFTNTLKSVIIMSVKAYTKKCKPHITKHQNRRTKP